MKQLMINAIAILFVLDVVSKQALAEPPQQDIFGPEWTFSQADGEAISSSSNAMTDRMHEHLVESQPEAEKFTESYGRFTSPEGWWVKVGFDIGSVEVTAKPMTVADWKKYSANIQDAVFASAANVGFFPALFRGGGHINVGTENMSPLLIRNFLMDFFNHNELALGILNYDRGNAAAIEVDLTPEQIEQMISMFYQYDQGNVQHDARRLVEFYRYMGRLPNTDHELFLFNFVMLYGGKGSAINLQNLLFRHKEERRIEIRSVRPQASVDVFVRQIELLQARLNFLRRLDKPLPYKPSVTYVLQPNPFDPPVDPQQALRAFYTYVEESGLNWKDHRDYLWPAWQNAGGELDKFEKSKWFFKRQIISFCKRLLR